MFACFVDLDRAFDRVQWLVFERVIREKGMPKGFGCVSDECV